MTFTYSGTQARRDLLAGLTVAAISLPQAMAYALIAGVDPRFGLYSAIVITAVASIFGSSAHLINGPTNAISLVVFSALAAFYPDVQGHAIQALFLLGIMAGILQILIAVFRLGDLTRYISESVVIGFMAGAGFLIALGQVANFFGLHSKGDGHDHVLVRFWITLTQGGPINYRALAIGAGTVALVLSLRLLVRRFRLPQIEMLVGLLVAAGVAARLGWTIPGATGKTIIAVVGSVPASLPTLHVPQIQWDWISQLGGGAVAIATLGLLEALAIAKSIAHQTRQPLNYNRQCFAEGIGNLVGGFFQCLPGSGSLTRSAINFQSGAATRFSGLFASGAVAIVLVLFAPLARYTPKAALAGLLLITAVRLVDWPRLVYALRASRFDTALVLATAFSAIFITVEFSVLIGVALSILLFIPRAARLRTTELVVTPEGLLRDKIATDPSARDLLIYDFEGELFFGAATEADRAFDEMLQRARLGQARCVVLRVRSARNPDAVFLERLEDFLREAEKKGVIVLLAGVRPDFAQGLRNLKFDEWLPPDRIFREDETEHSATLAAVRHAYELLGLESPRRPAHEPGEAELYYLI